MSTVISIIIILFLVIFALYGFLISLEFLKYFKRKIHLKLDFKLNKEKSND